MSGLTCASFVALWLSNSGLVGKQQDGDVGLPGFEARLHGLLCDLKLRCASVSSSKVLIIAYYTFGWHED